MALYNCVMTGRSSGPTISMMASAMRILPQQRFRLAATRWGSAASVSRGIPSALPYRVAAKPRNKNTPPSALRPVERGDQLLPGGHVPVRKVGRPILIVLRLRFRLGQVFVRGGRLFGGLRLLGLAAAAAPPAAPRRLLGGRFLLGLLGGRDFFALGLDGRGVLGVRGLAGAAAAPPAAPRAALALLGLGGL